MSNDRCVITGTSQNILKESVERQTKLVSETSSKKLQQDALFMMHIATVCILNHTKHLGQMLISMTNKLKYWLTARHV